MSPEDIDVTESILLPVANWFSQHR